MNKKRKLQRLLAAVLAGIMTIVSVNAIPAFAEENMPDVKKKLLFSSNFDRADSSLAEDGWTKATSYRWFSQGYWEYPQYVGKGTFEGEAVMQFGFQYYTYYRATKTLSTEGMKELVVEFDVIASNGQTAKIGLMDLVPETTGTYISNIGQDVCLWSGAPSVWTRVKVEVALGMNEATATTYTKDAKDPSAAYEPVDAYKNVSIGRAYLADDSVNICFYSDFASQDKIYFDNVEMYSIVTEAEEVEYKEEQLFGANFENSSSTFQEDGWTEATAWRYGSSWTPNWWEYPDRLLKTRYDNKNVLQFYSTNWAYHRVVKSVSIEGLTEMSVEFDMISQNGVTVQFGLVDLAPAGDNAYNEKNNYKIGDVLWSGAQTEWTRVKVVFSLSKSGVMTTAYTKNLADAEAQYEEVSGYLSHNVSELYTTGDALNVCLYSEFGGGSSVIFDNFGVYTTHAYKNGKCIDCGKYKDGIAALGGYSLTLAEGTIGLNFYMDMNAELPDASKTEMQFTVNGRTQTMTYADAKSDDTGNYRIFTCEVYAKQMADEITAVMYNDGASGNTYTYSVKQYADKLLADEAAYAKEIPLVQAMLNYGSYAQEYFRYNTENLANGGTYLGEKALSAVTTDVLAVYAGNITTGNDRVKLISASLVLDAQTSLRLYLSIPHDVTVEGLKQSRYGSYVERKGILPQDLTEDVTESVSYGEQSVDITYNCMAYCHNVLKSSGATEELKNVVRALYLYSQSAAAYAGK